MTNSIKEMTCKFFWDGLAITIMFKIIHNDFLTTLETFHHFTKPKETFCIHVFQPSSMLIQSLLVYKFNRNKYKYHVYQLEYLKYKSLYHNYKFWAQLLVYNDVCKFHYENLLMGVLVSFFYLVIYKRVPILAYGAMAND